MPIRKNGFVYTLVILVGWIIILCGTATVAYLLFAVERTNENPIIFGGLAAMAIGVLIVRTVERNIIKALGTALNHIFGTLTW